MTKPKKKRFIQVSVELLESIRFLNLSKDAKLILIYSMRYYYDRDPYHTFTFTWTEIVKTLHFGRTQTMKSIKELIEHKYWFLVTKASRNKPAVYRHNHSLLTTNID